MVKVLWHVCLLSVKSINLLEIAHNNHRFRCLRRRLTQRLVDSNSIQHLVNPYKHAYWNVWVGGRTWLMTSYKTFWSTVEFGVNAIHLHAVYCCWTGLTVSKLIGLSAPDLYGSLRGIKPLYDIISSRCTKLTAYKNLVSGVMKWSGWR